MRRIHVCALLVLQLAAPPLVDTAASSIAYDPFTQPILQPSPAPATDESCDDISDLDQRGKCDFYKHTDECEEDGIIDYGRWYWCGIATSDDSSIFGKLMFFLFMVVELVLLFTLLGSTADSFFSPVLEQISEDMGLPPRFAGVTFLALGNGAPDVSSTISAVKDGHYQLSLGALTGAGMFVTTVVAGAVMVKGGGAKCRGATCRDVSAYFTVLLVLIIFLSGDSWGYRQVFIFLAMYFSYTTTVLLADIWHRKITLPKREARPLLADLEETVVPDVDEDLDNHHLLAPDNGFTNGLGHDDMTKSGRLPGDVMGNYNFASYEHEIRAVKDAVANNPFDEDGLSDDGASTIVSDVSHARQHHQGYHTSEYRLRALAALSESSSGRQAIYEEAAKRAMNAQRETLLKNPLLDTVDENGVAQPNEDEKEDEDEEESEGFPEPEGLLTVKERFKWEMQRELFEFRKLKWYYKPMYILEFPFMMLRRFTVPMTSTGEYSRPFLLGSLIGMPVWLVWYLGLLTAGYGLPLIGGMLLGGLMCFACYLICDDETPPRYGMSWILAILGFVVAATWIDTIANELVNVLQFMGLAAGVDSDVLGLTVLAWGNSIGDFSTNMAMARKGLGNMAMTACFAGPLFNMLVGLGVGFLLLLNSGDSNVDDGKYPVELSTKILLGALCLMFNCVGMLAAGLTKFRGSERAHVPRQYGYFSVSLYCVYLFFGLMITVGVIPNSL